jgi:hypothetical protein
MNQAKTYCNVKLKINVTLKILNQMPRFKLHCKQHSKIFLKHVIILKMARVENLPNLEHSDDLLFVWPCKVETDVHEGLYW